MPIERRLLGLLVGIATIASVALVGARSEAQQQQQRVDAVTVAGSVQTFYDRTKGLKARFHQTYYHKLYDRYDRSEGQVFFEKPGKMRWNYARPNGKIIVSDGSRITVFEPGSGSEPGQVFDQELGENQLPQAFSFLTGAGRLADDFSFRLLDAARQGFREGYVLELRPREASPHYDRILFYVAKRDNRPIGVVRRVLIVDATGNRNRFDFDDMEFDPTLPTNTFRFTPPANARRVTP